MTMKQYHVRIPIHATKIITVVAENEDKAIERGYELAEVSLCWNCSQELEIDSVDIDTTPSVVEY